MALMYSQESIEPATISVKTESLSISVPTLATSNLSTTARTASPVVDKSKSKACGVCNEHEARYKCSRCQLPYCSVACATMHRATHPAVIDDILPVAIKMNSSPITNGLGSKAIPGTLSSTRVHNPFSALEGARELRTLFLMYPRLRSQLRDIYVATLPPSDSSPSLAGQHEEYVYKGRGKGRVRSSRGRERERGSWNTDRGTQDGIDALCRAKEEYGKGGEGIREYTELILKLVTMDGVDVSLLVQDEVAEENAKIIAQLLNEDPF